MKKKKTINKEKTHLSFLEEKESEKEENLLLSIENNKTCVFFKGREIICHKNDRPFIEIEIKNKNNTKKKIPLSYVYPKKENEKIYLNFVNKGYEINVVISEKEENVSIRIFSKNEYEKAYFSFPRGTFEKFYGIQQENKIKKDEIYLSNKKNSEKNKSENAFYIEIPNFISSENYLFNLKTNEEWEIKINQKEINVGISSKEGKVKYFFGEDEEEILNKYKKNKMIYPKFPILLRQGIIISVTKENVYRKVEKIIDAEIKVSGIILEYEELEKENLQEIVAYCKKRKIKVIVKIKPYIKVNKIDEKIPPIIKTKENKNYICKIENKKYFAIDLTNENTTNWIKKKIREILDMGVFGIIAEKGKLLDNNIQITNYTKESIYSWYKIWQKTIKEIMNEYEEKILFIRDIGSYSPKYGVLLAKETSWGNIYNKNSINEYIEVMKKKGIGNIIVEIGGTKNKNNTSYKNQENWFSLAKEMPLVIIGDVPEKIIIKNKEYLQIEK